MIARRSFRILIGICGKGGLVIAAGTQHGLYGWRHLFRDEHHFHAERARDVYECAGAEAAAQHLLKLVRRRGRYVQIGLFGKPIGWDVDQLVYKELIATGTNASVPSSWIRALQLMGEGKVQTKPLITHEYEVTDWKRGFDTFEDRTGIKTIFYPVN